MAAADVSEVDAGMKSPGLVPMSPTYVDLQNIDEEPPQSDMYEKEPIEATVGWLRKRKAEQPAAVGSAHARSPPHTVMLRLLSVPSNSGPSLAFQLKGALDLGATPLVYRMHSKRRS